MTKPFAESASITFLGTGTSQGVPVIACDCHVCHSIDWRDKRSRSSILIEACGESVVVDTGPDFRTQMLRERVKRLSAVLFTHAHKDHTAGLDDVRPFYFMNKADIPVYGTEPVLRQIKQEFSYAFSEKRYPGVPSFALCPITQEPFSIGSLPIIPIEVMHHKLPVLGFRIFDFVYITDANYISEASFELMKGCKVLVVNALHREEHISHFNLEQALEVANRVKPDQAYFTHISHNMGTHAGTMKELPPRVALAHDGLKVKL